MSMFFYLAGLLTLLNLIGLTHITWITILCIFFAPFFLAGLGFVIALLWAIIDEVIGVTK